MLAVIDFHALGQVVWVSLVAGRRGHRAVLGRDLRRRPGGRARRAGEAAGRWPMARSPSSALVVFGAAVVSASP